MTESLDRALAPTATAAARVRRWLPIAVTGSIAVLVFATGWHRELTIENVAILRERFHGLLAGRQLLAVLIYVSIYVAVVSLSLPGAFILTLTGGLLFGGLLGGAAAVVGATLGAIVIFLVARSAFGEVLATRAGPSLTKFQAGFKANALSYLLFLRIVPAFPFFLVNLAPALLGVPLRTYIIGTAFGVIPASFAFASVGAGLNSVIVAARAEQAKCLAAALGSCSLRIDAQALITREMLIGFAMLGLVALLPVALKAWRRQRGGQ
jgi:uncharacterized membrane protein YdjX (TVP38/TMEM64 family)